jgi:succinate dehydrogenase / fumarate reductase cytochrome b subunit
VAFHLGNGISNIAMGWGLAESQSGQRRFEVISIATFLVLLAMAWGAIYGLWAAGAAFAH